MLVPSQFEAVFWWCAMVLGVGLIVIHNWMIFPWMLDDSFISFRYSEQFASGHGLVFNVGERVEGYTTFLWVFLLGLGKMLGLETVTLARVLGSLSAGATVGLTGFAFRIIPGFTRVTSAIAVLLLCSCGIFSPWPSSGMEVCLFTLLILLAIVLYTSAQASRSSVRLSLVGVVGALMVMTRPEGILLIGVLAGYAMYRLFRYREWQQLYFLVSFAVIYGGYFGWRYMYYGYLLPNTFYAKVGSTSAQLARGWEYVEDMGIASLPLIGLALMFVWRSGLRLSLFTGLTVTYILLHIIYVLLVGGDCMPAFRFMTPLIPLLALLAALGIESLRSQRKLAIVVFALAIGFNVYQMFFALKITGYIKADRVATRGKEVGLWLKEHVAPGTLIATNTAGTIPYYSELPVIDMLGLNDVHIAHREIDDMGGGMAGHEKGDGKYVLGRQPAIIQFHSSVGRREPSFRSDRELFDIPEFQKRYSPVAIIIPTLDERAIFYVRNDFVFRVR